MIYLLNAAIMPTEGTYSLRRISEIQFVAAIQAAHAAGERIESSIGYADTLDHITNLLLTHGGAPNLVLELSRRQTALAPRARGLICKPRYRVAQPGDKGKFVPAAADYEYFYFEFRADAYHCETCANSIGEFCGHGERDYSSSLEFAPSQGRLQAVFVKEEEEEQE